jgi:mono/diheme cytochrome c family protein
MKNQKIIGALATAVLLGLCAYSADANENWTKHCAACHGKDGKGETKAGKKAGVKDQTDGAYQAARTDEQMFKAIKDGLKEDGKEKMKPFGDKLTDAEIKEIVAFVRGLKK